MVKGRRGRGGHKSQYNFVFLFKQNKVTHVKDRYGKSKGRTYIYDVSRRSKFKRGKYNQWQPGYYRRNPRIRPYLMHGSAAGGDQPTRILNSRIVSFVS